MDFPKADFRNILLDPIPLDGPPIMLPGKITKIPAIDQPIRSMAPAKSAAPIQEQVQSPLKNPVPKAATTEPKNLKSPTNDTNSVVNVPGEGLRLRKTTESTRETVQDVFKDMKTRLRKNYGKQELFNRYSNDITGSQGEFYERVKHRATVTIAELRPKTREHILHIFEREKPSNAEDLLTRAQFLRPDL